MLFQKPFRVKTQTSMKGSGRKKLRADVGTTFPELSGEQLNDVIPPKEDVSMVKVQLNGGDVAVFYSVLKNPIVFEHNGKLYPTVYLLWRYPDLLPAFTTYPPVLSKLAAGADLMLPGVYTEGQDVTPQTFKHLKKGDTCSVNLVTNRASVAVGKTVLSGEDMYLSGMKGHGVHILHIVGDHLWASGDMSEPPCLGDYRIGEGRDTEMASLTKNPELKSGDEEVELISSNMEDIRIAGDGQESGEDEKKCEEERNEGIEVVEGESVRVEAVQESMSARESIETMNDRLLFCFKCALKGRLKQSDLPILTSSFFKTCMLPYCPKGQTLDVKKSSYRKLSKFLQEMQNQQFIVVKEVSAGVDQIVSLNKSHLELRGFELPEISEERLGTDAEETGSPEIVELLSITASGLDFLKSYGYKKGDIISPTEVRKILTDFVITNKLKDPSKNMVRLDPTLSAALLSKSDGNVTHLNWDQIFSRFMEKLKPAYEIRFPGRPPIIKKGKVPPIRITIHQRGGNKKVTLVENLEEFGIDPKVLAHTVQLSVQCSTSVGEGREVTIQGNQVPCVADLLLDKYQIPRKYIQGLENAPKNKRR